MLCEKCDNFEATFHLTEISNDICSELHLCMRCAKNIKFNSQIKDKSLSLKSMFSFLDNNDNSMNESNTICLNCGLTSTELSIDGRPGCPICYKYFRSILNTISININAYKYSGKKPLNYIEIMDYKKPDAESNRKKYEGILDLEEELRVAVLEERYEAAAELRDRIKEVKVIE